MMGALGQVVTALPLGRMEIKGQPRGKSTMEPQ